MTDSDVSASSAAEGISLAEFLQTAPPDTQLTVISAAERYQYGLRLTKGDIRLHCSSERCSGKGELHFRYSGDDADVSRDKWSFKFLAYTCRNCQTTTKSYAIAAKLEPSGYSANIYKLGEIPTFGPPVPPRMISLIGPDRELFLAGRRAENRGLGIGAFAYYRRVVENQKGRIIRDMARVAAKLGAPEPDLMLFEAAASETQFGAAIDKISPAIPPALRIDGHNPLTLLHAALSDGIHERSDEECLECAREIRLVLTELAERMAQVLREKIELKDAVNKLLQRRANKELSGNPEHVASPVEKATDEEAWPGTKRTPNGPERG